MDDAGYRQQYSLGGRTDRVQQLSHISLLDGGLNTFVGLNAGAKNYKGVENAYVGAESATVSDSSSRNVTVGAKAGYSLLRSNDNVIIGRRAGYSLADCHGAVIIGTDAGANVQRSRFNTMIGYKTGGQMISGTRNTFVGAQAGFYTLNASDNVFVGDSAGMNNRYGRRNTMVGTSAGKSAARADDCVFIGFEAGATASNISGSVAIGSNVAASSNSVANSVVIGDGAGGGAGDVESSVFVGAAAGAGSTGDPNCNTFVGYSAGRSSHASYDAAVGYLAAQGSEGSNNSIVGARAFVKSVGDDNVVMGADSGANTYMKECVLVGAKISLEDGFNILGERNTFVGYTAGQRARLSGNNTFVGASAGQQCLFVDQNVFVGAYAGSQAGFNAYATTANNVFIGASSGVYSSAVDNFYGGDRAGENTRYGGQNVFIGSGAGSGNFNLGRLDFDKYGANPSASRTYAASRNVCIGKDAGRDNLSGADNVMIGAQAGVNLSQSQRCIIIGEGAGTFGPELDCVVIGVRSGVNIAGSSDIVIGNHSAENMIGDDSIVVGHRSAAGSSTLTETIVIGTGVVNESGTDMTRCFVGGANVVPGSYTHGIYLTTGNVITAADSESFVVGVGAGDARVLRSNAQGTTVYGDLRTVPASGFQRPASGHWTSTRRIGLNANIGPSDDILRDDSGWENLTPNLVLQGIFAQSFERAWACFDSGQVAMTKDSGFSWDYASLAGGPTTLAPAGLTTCAVPGTAGNWGNQVWAVGPSGAVIFGYWNVSQDDLVLSDVTWEYVDVEKESVNWSFVAAINSQVVWIAGSTIAGESTILVTGTAGESWTDVSLPVGSGTVTGFSASVWGTAWACAGDGVYVTTDAGQTWTLALEGQFWSVGSYTFVGGDAVDPGVSAVVSGSDGVRSTIDGGVTWTTITPTGYVFDSPYNRISMSGNTIYVTCEGKFIVSENFGESWDVRFLLDESESAVSGISTPSESVAWTTFGGGSGVFTKDAYATGAFSIPSFLDDGYVRIGDMGFDFFLQPGVNVRDSMFAGTNGYLTFGAGSSAAFNLSAANPAVPTLFVQSRDLWMGSLYTWRQDPTMLVVRYEGEDRTYQTDSVSWEVMFKSDNTMIVTMCLDYNSVSDPVAGMSDGAGAWLVLDSGIPSFTGYAHELEYVSVPVGVDPTATGNVLAGGYLASLALAGNAGRLVKLRADGTLAASDHLDSDVGTGGGGGGGSVCNCWDAAGETHVQDVSAYGAGILRVAVRDDTIPGYASLLVSFVSGPEGFEAFVLTSHKTSNAVIADVSSTSSSIVVTTAATSQVSFAWVGSPRPVFDAMGETHMIPLMSTDLAGFVVVTVWDGGGKAGSMLVSFVKTDGLVDLPFDVFSAMTQKTDALTTLSAAASGYNIVVMTDADCQVTWTFV